jgi:glucoamylase
MEIPEQAVLGNSQMLVVIGKHGELRYLFWPTIDYPQHVLGSLPGIFHSAGSGGRFDWLTDSPWNRTQQYVKDTNVLLTSFENAQAKLSVAATDFVLPDANVLVRNFVFRNTGVNDTFLRFFYYNDLAISESNIDDAAYYLEKDDAIVHYKRNFYFLYGGTSKSSGHQCGVHGESSDAFRDIYDSRLSGGSLVLYDGTRDVDSCLSWDIGILRPDESKALSVFVVMGPNEKEVLTVLEEKRQTKFQELLKKTEDFWTNWVKKLKHDFKDDILNRLVNRSLLVLKLLTDQNHGGIIAAPCMEPEYRFCWPRDATYVAYALDLCGFHDEAEKFYHWCRRAQEPEGGLYQRYYIEARIRGPCWSSQIDEVATVIWGIGKHFDLTGDRSFIESMWVMIEKASDFICKNIDSNTGLAQSVGLWEERFGSHSYSNAAIYSALKTSAKIGKLLGKNSKWQKWHSTAETVKSSLLRLAWSAHNDRFMKTFNPEDESVDVSLLGLVFPFEVLPADDDRIKRTALAIERAFRYKAGGIGRYSADFYYGGNPWILGPLWLALYYEKLKDRKKMEQLIRWAVDHVTGLDLLAEQVDKETGMPISAIPLAWSHAFFIAAVIGLDALGASTTGTGA